LKNILFIIIVIISIPSLAYGIYAIIFNVNPGIFIIFYLPLLFLIIILGIIYKICPNTNYTNKGKKIEK
jgi:hypothetical protein